MTLEIKESKMKKSKFFKFASASVLGTAVTVGLTSCNVPYQNSGVFQTYTATDLLENNNSPLNSAFSNSPISTYAESILYNLVTYQTVGNFSFSSNNTTNSTTSDYLKLDAAKAVFIFKDDTTATAINNYLTSKHSDFDLTKLGSLSNDSYEKILEELKVEELDTNGSTSSGQSSSSTKFKEGTDYWVFQRKDGALQFQNGIGNTPWDPRKNSSSNSQSRITAETQPNEVTVNSQTEYYKNAISNGTVYQFIVDTDNSWVDSKGNVKQTVSSKDFERAIEIYNLAASLNYNRNGYFLDLIGLDFNKTAGYTSTSNSSTYSYQETDSEGHTYIKWENYNVNNFKNLNDSVFTFYITEAYPYTFGMLTKEYFAALPNTNQKIKNIHLQSGTPIDYDVNDGSYAINQSDTNWSRIYGSGGLGEFTQDVWFAGAYYISAFTSANLIFQLNNTYMESAGKDLLDSSTGSTNKTSRESRIKTISVSHGSGTTDTFYELFKSKQNDFLAAVSSDKMSEAAGLFKGRGLTPRKVVQASQSNYITYTPSAYVMSGTSVIKNEYLGNMADFIYQWNSEDSYTIRAAISGLVNWKNLSSVNLPSSGDFQLSATPYGVFNGYYEQVAAGNLYGGLPRTYTTYTSTTNDMLGDFTIPYYTYSSSSSGSSSNNSGVTVKQLTISQSSLQTALTNFGATRNNPLEFSIKFGETFTSNYQNYLNRVKQTIERLSGGLIRVSLIQRLATTPSASDWFNKQSSPLGFSYWSPDYNGVGTWIEADTTIQSSKIGETTVEAIPATNAHNSYLTFLSSMVSAVKVMGATWDSSSTPNKYTVTSTTNGTTRNLSTNNTFDSDTRIATAFKNDTLSAMGISLSAASSTPSSYDISNITDSSMSAGNRYGLLAIGLLNKLIENDVIDQSKFQEYVNDPSKLNTKTSAPTNYNELYIGNDVIKAGASGYFSKWIGVYAGEGTAQALYETTVLDSDYSFLPRSESGLTDIIYSLVNPNYTARIGTQSTNYRDFGWNN
ncbi:putative lipoprotein [Malacoplasma penetrans HF-2]|uniref:Lipoprotein n=2 Tax=Malacoplasma penetrans TaxID=28227 RepID=Q8EV06_MALP2|nr:putative lipoprotein [Malacoplasma penetrans HF-2]